MELCRVDNKQIQKLQTQLNLMIEINNNMEKIKDELLIHGIDLRNGCTDTNHTACRYVLILMMSEYKVNQEFIAEVVNCKRANVSLALKKAKFYSKTSDTLFLHWNGIINNIK